jgi:hypothetical protein
VFVLVVFGLPPSLSRAEQARRIWHTSRIDLDNCTKLVLDALNGVAWDDDRQVVFGVQSKLWSSTEEQYAVWVVPLPDDPSDVVVSLRGLNSLVAGFVADVERRMVTGRAEILTATMNLVQQT